MDPQELPSQIQEDINRNWNRTIEKNPGMYESYVPFLISMSGEEEKTIQAQARPFSVISAYHRNTRFYDREQEVQDHSLMHLSSLVHLVTRDNYLLFGTKSNQANQISGFGGFPNIEKESEDSEGDMYLNIQTSLEKKLSHEIGKELVKTIAHIDAVGMTYTNTLGLRGVDLDYLAELDIPADDAAQLFQESAQFKKSLYKVPFNPLSIQKFITDVYHIPGNDGNERNMSRYALGALYHAVHAHYGKDEAENVRDTITKDMHITFAQEDETGYLK